METKNKREILTTILAVLIPVFLVSGVALAVTIIGTNISTEGNTTLGDAAADTVHFNANAITFEGATADAFETTFAITDPTADRTITFQNVTGTVYVTGGTDVADGDVADNLTISGGTVNNSIIGGGVAAAGTFTTLSAGTSLTIGAGTAITQHLSDTQASLVSANIGATACADYGTITVNGAAVGDTAVATPTAVGGGIETVNLSWSAYVSAPNTVTIRACNPTAAGIDTGNTQTWRADVWKH